MGDDNKPLPIGRRGAPPAPLRPHRPVEIPAFDRPIEQPRKIADPANPKNIPQVPGGPRPYDSAIDVAPGASGVRHYFARTPEAEGFFATVLGEDGKPAYREVPRDRAPAFFRWNGTDRVFIRVKDAAVAAAPALDQVVTGRPRRPAAD